MDDASFDTALTERVFRSLTGRGVLSLPALLGTAFGTGPRGGVHVEQAATTLGVSRSTVYRWLAGTPPRDAARAQARAVAAAAFGTGPRGGVNVAAAAAELGVSRSTVYRWLSGRIPPARVEQLTAAAQARVAGSPHGRAVSAQRARSDLLARIARDPRTGTPIPPGQQRARVTVAGEQNISKDYADKERRWRRIQFDLTPDQVNGLFDVWERGGDPELVNYLENAASTIYRGFGDPDTSPDDLAADDPYRGWWFRSIDSIEFE